MSRRISKPIRVFWSPFSRRFYATRAWKDVPGHPGVVTVTGEQFDVTDDIASVVLREGITFRPENVAAILEQGGKV